MGRGLELVLTGMRLVSAPDDGRGVEAPGQGLGRGRAQGGQHDDNQLLAGLGRLFTRVEDFLL